MKKLLLILLPLIFYSNLFCQSITNVVFKQQGDNIIITYNLSSETPLNIEVYYSTDAGETYKGPIKNLSGDAGKSIKQGTGKKIIWNVLKDTDMLYTEHLIFKVKGKSSFCDMVFVKGGTFQMGSNDGSDDEKPIHTVTVTGFYIGKYEVTQKQWKEIMGSNPSSFKDCDNCPVESVSWNDVQNFLKKLNEKTGGNYRLPTEAEWEYAARGGNKTNGYKYSGSNSVDDVAWYTSNSGSKTHTVGTKQANELGIYDMSGNVWEWCGDWYDKDYYKNSPENNPKGASSGLNRVLRGGSWAVDAGGCRSANRLRINPGSTALDVGFRICLSVLK